MSKAQRDKGKRGELQAVNALRTLLNDKEIRRAIGQTRDGGADLEGGVLDPYWHVEVKRGENPRIKAWLDKPYEEQKRIPVVMHRKNREEWAYYLRLSPKNIAVLFRTAKIMHPDGE